MNSDTITTVDHEELDRIRWDSESPNPHPDEECEEVLT